MLTRGEAVGCRLCLVTHTGMMTQREYIQPGVFPGNLWRHNHSGIASVNTACNLITSFKDCHFQPTKSYSRALQSDPEWK